MNFIRGFLVVVFLGWLTVIGLYAGWGRALLVAVVVTVLVIFLRLPRPETVQKTPTLDELAPWATEQQRLARMLCHMPKDHPNRKALEYRLEEAKRIVSEGFEQRGR